MLVNTEVQCICAGTPICVCIVVYIGAGLCVSSPVPSETVTRLLGEGIVGTVVDGEVQRVNIGASGVGLRVVEGIGTGYDVCCSIPRVLFA